ncbi:MAG: hypothetical protein K0R39_4664 [Symbiobacteriaceae bacterium]|nr:hypothetical protein [Symbiobacteriaceae bacterium]
MNFQGLTTTQLTINPQFQCRSGFVNLFRFIQAPPPGSVIGQILTQAGNQIPLVQTQQTPLGGTSLSSVDNRFATLCGVFVRVGGQIALDVRIVNPGAPSPTGTPVPVNVRELLILLLLLLLFGNRGVSIQGINLSTLDINQLLSTPQATALLSQAGLTTQTVINTLAALQ